MAVSVVNQPANFQGVHNPLMYVLTSTNVAQPNFQYIIDIYITGIASYIRIKRRPESTDRGLVDLSAIVRDYVSYNLETSGASFYLADTSFIEVVVKFGEEYGTPPAITPDLTILTAKYFINSALPFLFNTGYDPFLNERIVGSPTSLFLTNAPREATVLGVASSKQIPVVPTQSAWLYFLKNSAAGAVNMILNRYMSDGTAMAPVTITNAFAADSAANKYLIFASGPFNLNEIPGGDLSGDTQSLIDDTVAYYTLQLTNGEGAFTSELFRYIIDYDCLPFEYYTLHFQNVFGAFDPFTFRAKSTIIQDIERTRFEKRPGNLVGNQFFFTKSDRGTVDGAVKYNDTYTVTSGALTQEQVAWLSELASSPQVFWEQADFPDEFIAVNILTQSFEIKQKANEKLMFVEFEFALSVSSNRQYQ